MKGRVLLSIILPLLCLDETCEIFIKCIGNIETEQRVINSPIPIPSAAVIPTYNKSIVEK